MDDWDDIVREAGEEHAEDIQDLHDDLNDTIRISEWTKSAVQTEKTDQSNKEDTVDHDAAPSAANDEEQCRICFSGVEEEPELGVRLTPTFFWLNLS